MNFDASNPVYLLWWLEWERGQFAAAIELADQTGWDQPAARWFDRVKRTSLTLTLVMKR